MTHEEQVASNVGRQMGLAFSLRERAIEVEPTFTTLAQNLRKEARERMHYAHEAAAFSRLYQGAKSSRGTMVRASEEG